MPKLIRFLVFHAAIGFAVALAVVTIFMAFNVANLRTLINGSDAKWLALFCLVAVETITFSSVVMGIAVMRLPKNWQDETPSEPAR